MLLFLHMNDIVYNLINVCLSIQIREIRNIRLTNFIDLKYSNIILKICQLLFN